MTRKNSLLLLAAPAAFLGFAAPAAAQQWTGAIDNDYNNAGNWDTGVVPNNAAADVVVNTMTNAPVMDLQTLGWRWYLGTLTIGDTADASLTFADGFAVTAAETVVAAHAGATASLNVQGVVSPWPAHFESRSITIGASGVGYLNVADGGFVHTGNATGGVLTLGANADGEGHLNVASGGRVILETLNVGRAGAGTATLAGGVNHLWIMDVGVLAGSTGSVSVSGAGTEVWSNNRIAIGMAGEGEMTVSGGAYIYANSATIGSQATGVGRLDLSGTGTHWNGWGFNVGYLGQGEANVLDGALLTTGASSIGSLAGSSGAVRVAGDGSDWTATQIRVGERGEGSLHIADGGAVSTGIANIGGFAGARGVLNVTGEGSTFTASAELQVGSAGEGTLAVLEGAAAAVGRLMVGVDSDAQGWVVVDGEGSNLSAGEVQVGAWGEGALSVLNGAAVEVSAMIAGAEIHSHGSILVDGEGSSLSISGLFSDIGRAGRGEMIISGGAEVINVHANIGGFAGSSGAVAVIGEGSVWLNEQLVVGANSAGELRVADGAHVSSVFSMIGSTSTGAATVTGDGSRWDADTLYVGSSGVGALEIADGGAVAVSGAAYLGRFDAGSGSVSVDGAGSLLAVTEALIVGYDGFGEVEITNGGVVTAAFVALGAGGGAITIDGASSLDTPAIMFGQGGHVAFSNAGDRTIAAAFSGGDAASRISFNNAGIITLTGASHSYAGVLDINGGSIFFNAGFGGAVNLNDGLAGGSGSIGALNVGYGATLAPGNSIGALRVSSANFGLGSIFQVEVNAAGQGDLLIASGAVTIDGGAVQVLAEDGAYAPATTYTIIDAASVTGTFATITSNLAFLEPTLAYTANNVVLTMSRNDIDFSAIAVTGNQASTAEAIEALGLGNEIWDDMVGKSAAGAQAAFEALSGDFHAGLNGGGYGDALGVFSMVQTRLDSLAQAPRQIQLASLDPSIPSADPRRAVWGQVFAAHSDIGGDNNAAGLDLDRAGLIVGADAPIGAGHIGAALHYQDTRARQDARRARGEVEAVGVSLYGGARAGAFNLSGEIGYDARDIGTERRVLVAGTEQHLLADYDAQSTHVQGRIGYVIEMGASALEPFLSLAYVNVETDAFTETGGSAALMRVAQSDEVSFTTLGVRMAREFGLNGRDGAVFGSIGWRHAEGDILPNAEMAFASNPGVAFAVSGAPIAEDALALELGLGWRLGESLDLSAAYRGDLADDAESHGASLRLRLRR